jgi:hypothetical protein
MVSIYKNFLSGVFMVWLRCKGDDYVCSRSVSRFFIDKINEREFGLCLVTSDGSFFSLFTAGSHEEACSRLRFVLEAVLGDFVFDSGPALGSSPVVL